MSILQCFRDIINYFPEFQEITWPRPHHCGQVVITRLPA